MKKISAFLIAGLMVLVIGCKKDISKNDPIGPENPVSWQQNISPNFDWNMWKDVNVLLTNTQNKIITITTVDGEGQYAKMMGLKDSYQLTLRIPKITEQISINGNILNIQNGAVVFALPADYKSVASAAWALDFDRNASDYINAGDPGIDTYPFTMEAWIKTSGGSNMAIMGYCSSANDEYQFGVYVDGTDGKLSIRSKKGLVSEEEKGSSVVTDNLWHHVAVVFASATTSRLYVDGTLKATETAASPLLPTEVNVFTIGRWGDLNPDSYFDGIIDEVRIWNTERLAGQINTYRTRSISYPYTGMAGYWPMEEGSGTQTVNKVGNGMIDLIAPNWIGDIDTDEDNITNINDDYPHDPTRAFNNYWPATAGTLAFEDLWPSMGDYDMNDVVMGYSFNRVTNANNQLVEGIGTMTLKATGASLNAGFGFSLPDNVVEANHLNISGYQVNSGYITLNPNHSEAGQDTLTVIVDDLLPKPGNTYMGKFSRTYTYTVTLSITGGTYDMDDFGFQTWNPFIMVDHKIPNRRGHEIHLPGYARTNKVNVLLFDSADDGSEYPAGGGGNLWYKTNVKAMASADSVGQYFPWGLDIPGDFNYTIEANLTHQPPTTYRHTIWWGYRKFKQWAGSNGTEALDWYSVNNSVYRDQDFIWAP